jgi:4-hydroxy-3-polyprenylbenzoate decarboxylase
MRIVVGISGSTGVIYGIRLLQVLAGSPNIETHLVMSNPAKQTIGIETSFRVEEVAKLATKVYPINDIAAAISSGSFHTDGMIVIPCSMKTVSAIANSYNDNLLVRAADVTLKERRPLVVVARETPLHLGHLRHMTQVAEMGGIIFPPVPAFYHRPKTVDDIINQTVARVLDLFGIERQDLFTRWTGAEDARSGNAQG